MFYIDTLALIKLALDENHTLELSEFVYPLMESARKVLISSIFVELEIARVLSNQRVLIEKRKNAKEVLKIINLKPFNEQIFALATNYNDRHLSVINSIHLATIKHYHIEKVITYDKQLIECCKSYKIETISP